MAKKTRAISAIAEILFKKNRIGFDEITAKSRGLVFGHVQIVFFFSALNLVNMLYNSLALSVCRLLHSLMAFDCQEVRGLLTYLLKY